METLYTKLCRYAKANRFPAPGIIKGSSIKSVKLNEKKSIRLKIALKQAKLYFFSSDFLEGFSKKLTIDYIFDNLHRIRLPFDRLWFEHKFGGVLIETIPKTNNASFRITLFQYTGINAKALEDIGGEYCAIHFLTLVFSPTNFQKDGESDYGVLSSSVRRLWKNVLNKVVPDNGTEENRIKRELHRRVFYNYINFVATDYLVESNIMHIGIGLLKSEDIGVYEEMMEMEIQKYMDVLYDLLTLLYVLNIGKEIGVSFVESDERTPIQSGGNTIQGVKHTIIKYDISKEYSLKRIKRIIASGIKKREHEVAGHWCVSRRKGRLECANVSRVCKPKAISETSNICETCGKLEWFKKDHMRGDPSIGTTIQTRIIE